MRTTFNKKLILTLWAMSCGVVCTAQDKKSSAQSRPDLTGIWERNPSKSKNSYGPLGTAVVRLVISHKDPELKITRQNDFKGQETITDSIYYTDGRGEKNESRFSTVVSMGTSIPKNAPDQSGYKRHEVRSKTKWEGSKLVSRSTTDFAVLGNRFDMDVTEKRELSPGGKTLTIVTTFLPGGSTLTEVFDRVQ